MDSQLRNQTSAIASYSSARARWIVGALIGSIGP
jgi:hypothetical protein